MPHARSIPDDAKETMKKLRSSGMPVKENSRAMQVAHPCNLTAGYTPVTHHLVDTN